MGTEQLEELKKKLVQVDFNPLEQDRVTAHFNLVHEHCGDPPVTVQCQYSDILTNIEQPYVRRMKVTEEWKSLDLGWIENPGYVILENRVGRGLLVNPTDEERELHKQQLLLIIPGPPWVVRPGRFFLAEPQDFSSVQIKAAKGIIPITIHVIPK